MTAGHRPAQHRHDPDAVHRRRAAGQLRAPGPAAGHGARRVPALHADHGAQPEGPDVAGPRPLRPVRGPRLDAALQRAAPVAATTSRWSELERFRQWGSLTPGHPERDRVHVTPGVEVTTGPLGQGFANGVGLALAERFLRERYGPEVQDHRVFAIVSDGDLMEGIASEAASLAGHLGLGRLVYLYDDNDVSLDGPDGLELLHGGRRQALRGLRLARAGRARRQRPRRARERHRQGHARGGPADAHPRQVDHRLRVARAGDVGGPRQGAGRGERPQDEGGARLGSRQALLRARRGARALRPDARAAPRCRPSGPSASARGARPTPTVPRSGTAPGRASRCPASPRR